MLKVRLSSLPVIEGMLEDYEGIKNLDGIKYDRGILDSLPTEVEVMSFGEYALGTYVEVKKPNGRGTKIHPKWCSSVTDGTTRCSFLSEVKILSDKYIKVSNGNILDIDAKDIKDSSTLPICTDCGSVAGNVVDGNHVCDNCLDTTYKEHQSYSYKPTPNFIGEQLRKDVDNPIHYGIELEYGLNGHRDIAKLRFAYKEEVYAKSDSTISGGNYRIELVTHPHSFKALMGKCFIDKLSTLNAVENRQTNGCHIHISRTAFVDDKHYAKWYFLIHEMKSINEYIGGRELTGYCSFNPSGHIFEKQKDGTGGDRGMINERNVATIEARFFSSTDNPDEVRMYVQYLESLIKYTKYSDDSVTIQGWKEYVNKYAKKYNYLVDKVNAYTGDITGSVTYRAPIVHKKDLKSLMAMELTKITNIHTTERVYNNVSHIRFDGHNQIYFHYNSDCDSKYVRVEDITEVEWRE